MAKEIFIYNFIIMVLLENSLQFILFSTINILYVSFLNSQNQSQVKDNFQTASEQSSFILSLCLILSLACLGIGNILLVTRGNAVQCGQIKEKYPKVAALYEMLQPYNKCALVFQSVFLIRRCLMALILIFIKDDKAVQVCSMMLVSLAQLCYLIAIKPFTIKSLNRLEIFNELIILICYYHLLMFTEGLSDDIYLVYNIGWSMDILLLFQFIVNIANLSIGMLLKFRTFIIRLQVKIRMQAKQRRQQAQKRRILEELQKLHEKYGDGLNEQHDRTNNNRVTEIAMSYQSNSTQNSRIYNQSLSQIAQTSVLFSQFPNLSNRKQPFGNSSVQEAIDDLLPVTLDNREIIKEKSIYYNPSSSGNITDDYQIVSKGSQKESEITQKPIEEEKQYSTFITISQLPSIEPSVKGTLLQQMIKKSANVEKEYKIKSRLLKDFDDS